MPAWVPAAVEAAILLNSAAAFFAAAFDLLALVCHIAARLRTEPPAGATGAGAGAEVAPAGTATMGALATGAGAAAFRVVLLVAVPAGAAELPENKPPTADAAPDTAFRTRPR